MTDVKYRKCAFCKTKAYWIKLFNVITSQGEDVKSNCPICNEDFCLDGVPSCGHSVCNKCFMNLEIISLNDGNNINRYTTPPISRRNEQSPPPPPLRRHYEQSSSTGLMRYGFEPRQLNFN